MMKPRDVRQKKTERPIMSSPKPILNRAQGFCETFGLQLPILMAPMAGACPTSLAAAVANAGGLGACGTLMMSPEEIGEWVTSFRVSSNGGFQLNLWIPDPTPLRDKGREETLRDFLGQWGPAVGPEAGDAGPLDFSAQCDAMLAAGPTAISSIMGLYPDAFVVRMKDQGVKWFATVTTVAEARAAAEAGADVIVAQGMEAGGHRGAFEAGQAERTMVGLFALLPAVCDAVALPVVATGGIADARGVAAALMLGASAAQIGTGLLRTPEASLTPAWADAIGQTAPEDTIVTRAFSGRAGRSVATAYARAANRPDTPDPAPYPVQRGLTGAMRGEGTKNNDIERMQAWAGQSARLAEARPASDLVRDIWADAEVLLGGS
jgi:nitronate monooxygenase